MRLKRAIQSLIITSTILTVTIPFSIAQHVDLAAETQKMRQQYATSDRAKFRNQHPDDARALRLYVNQLHGTAMSLLGKIQLELAQNQNSKDYAALYDAREADYIALRFCIEHHKFFNDAAIPGRLRANTSLTYATAAQKCDSPPLLDFLSKQKKLTQTWRDFTKMVEQSIPIDADKKAKFQNNYISQFSATAQQELARYKVMPYSKPLETGFFKAPQITVNKNQVINHYGLPPLPDAPFKHDEAEMKDIALHVKALTDRMNVNDKTGFIVEACRPVFESTKYDQFHWLKCTGTIHTVGKRQIQNTKATDAFYSFSIQYHKSARNMEIRQLQSQNSTADMTEEYKIVEKHGLPPLPDAPFKHNEAEMETIAVHVKALLERINTDGNAKASMQACHPVVNSNIYDLGHWFRCGRAIRQAGQNQAQNREVTEAFYMFNREYRTSAKKAALQSGKGI